MYNIKTYNKISSVATNEFDAKKYTIGDEVEAPVGAIVRSFCRFTRRSVRQISSRNCPRRRRNQ